MKRLILFFIVAVFAVTACSGVADARTNPQKTEAPPRPAG